MVPQVTRRSLPTGGATTADDLHGSVLLLVAPTKIVATVLAECFKGASDVRVIEDRRRPWPHGERRRVAETPAMERRRGDRRQSSRFRFVATVG
jgi:hypothetical protein